MCVQIYLLIFYFIDFYLSSMRFWNWIQLPLFDITNLYGYLKHNKCIWAVGKFYINPIIKMNHSATTLRRRPVA